MDRTMEYEIMCDLYDTYVAESYYGYEDYDDSDEYEDATEAYKPASFGQYLKISRKGKIRAFFRALFRRIGDFFKSLALRIKTFFARPENKAKYQEALNNIPKDRYIDNMVGRFADVIRKAKMPAIKVSEAMRKLMARGGVIKDMGQASKLFGVIDKETKNLEEYIDDIARISIHYTEKTGARTYTPDQLSSMSNTKERDRRAELRRNTTMNPNIQDDAEKAKKIRENKQNLTAYFKDVSNIIHYAKFKHKNLFDDMEDAFDKCYRACNEIVSTSDAINKSVKNGERPEGQGNIVGTFTKEADSYQNIYNKLSTEMNTFMHRYAKLMKGLGLTTHMSEKHVPSNVDVQKLNRS